MKHSLASKREWARNLELPDQPVGFTLDDAEKWAIVRAIKRTDGVVQDAALLLHIGRGTLYRKLDAYDLVCPKGPCSAARTRHESCDVI